MGEWFKRIKNTINVFVTYETSDSDKLLLISNACVSTN